MLSHCCSLQNPAAAPEDTLVFRHYNPVSYNSKDLEAAELTRVASGSAAPADILLRARASHAPELASDLQDEVIAGKSMADWLRFAVCYWHTFRGKGLGQCFTAGIRRFKPALQN